LEDTEVKKIGKMGSLAHLYLQEVNNAVVTQFPLEQLERLVLIRAADGFPEFSKRLKSMKDLFICTTVYHRFKEFQFPARDCPYLAKLGLENFQSVDLTGTDSLKHLFLSGTNKIIGKEEVYPQLKSFAHISSYIGEPATFYQSQLQTLTDIGLALSTETEIDSFFLNDKIRSVYLNVKIKHIANCPENRSFHTVTPRSCSPTNYSVFSNVQQC
jgi:hypothetical protein